MARPKVFFLVLLLLFLGEPAQGQDPASWEAFKSRFISPDGRVIDFLQDQASHSEGQGFAMLLAVRRDDPKTFSTLRQWTQDNLQVRKNDSLHAWKWGRRPNGKWTVTDLNNASDGDILLAWSLLQAHKKWSEEAYRKQALAILTDIRKHLIVERKGGFRVLPGYYGFTEPGQEVLNPSYWVLPAFRHFALVDDPPYWQKVYGDAASFLKGSHFGSLQLPADWVLVKESGVSIHTEKSRFFGFEAIRLLLYLSWDGSLNLLPGVRPLLDIVKKLTYVPLTVDLAQDQISLEEACAGYYAIYARAARDLKEWELSGTLQQKARKKLPAEKDHYYSQILYLLSQEEMRP